MNFYTISSLGRWEDQRKTQLITIIMYEKLNLEQRPQCVYDPDSYLIYYAKRTMMNDYKSKGMCIEQKFMGSGVHIAETVVLFSIHTGPSKRAGNRLA